MNQEDEFFSVEEFKKWMQSQKESSPHFVSPSKKKDDVIGLTVESKISTLRLMEKIQTEGNPHILARDFRRNGGIIREANGSIFLIEVNSGTFYIPRCFVRCA
jgi:hypothetical protein